MLIKLAEALLRRKELNEKLKIVNQFKTANIYENKVRRIKVTEGIDEVTANVAKLSLSQVTHEHDYYASQLRKLDAAIQQINWTASVEVDDNAMKDYMDVYSERFLK